MSRLIARSRRVAAIAIGLIILWTGIAVSCSTTPCLDRMSKIIPAVVRIVAGDKMGSGVMVDKSGYILTSWHVVGAEKTVYLTLDSRAEYSGVVLATDQARDLALIRITGGNGEFACANLGSSVESDGLQTGDAIAIAGYPAYAGSASPTVSQGVLCAFPTIESVRFIQASAQVYPGSSGGPMLNCFGEVIGIVNGRYTNIGSGCTTFATAIDEAAGLMLIVNGAGGVARSPLNVPVALQPRICPDVGCRAPGFTLTGLDGARVSLDSLSGRKVLLVFTGTASPDSAKLMKCVSQVYDAWPREQLEVLIIVSGESDGAIRDWSAANVVQCKVLPDPNGQVAGLFSPASLPAMYFINTYGEIKVKRAGLWDNCASGIDALLKLY